MMMIAMMMLMTVMMTHRHFGSRSSSAGWQADFKVDEVRAISEDSPTIRDHDALARRLGRLVDCILEKRSGSMAQRSFYYPFKLAGLTSTDESVRREAMREFEKDVRALWAAKDL